MSPADPAPPSNAPPTPPAGKPSWRERLKTLVEEYGAIALVIYFGLFFLVWGLTTLAFALGLKKMDISTGGASVGAPTAGYLLTKVTQPFRIAATFVLTPIAARFWERLRGRAKPKA